MKCALLNVHQSEILYGQNLSTLDNRM